jgi:bidirectional [NiFe] hydrogenase diaphorase subunit
MSALVTLRIDGRTVRAEPDTFVLQAARTTGIDVPTLCDHPDLEPFGGCRLCMVEVSHPDWGGWSGLMTSCLYPVAEGLEISTRSDRVLQSRRQTLSLLLARCPSSETIRQLAAEQAVDAQPLFSEPDADKCILCGLCTRVCEAHATSAIATTGRGAVKEIGAFFDGPPPDCVGCGGCAIVCPTGEITGSRTATGYSVWQQHFPTAVARVERTTCTACGACEEACPFDVARVTFAAGGTRAATIPTHHCRGCGACVGACPSGAISQDGQGLQELLDVGGLGAIVMGCARTGLELEPADDTTLLSVPCSGRISVPLLLASVASGAEGMLVLGRQQQTCRQDGAEDPARARVHQAREVLAIAGLGADRVAFEVPEPGADGPPAAVAAFRSRLAKLGPNPLPELPHDRIETEGLDTTLRLLHWLATDGPEQRWGPWFADRDLPAARPGGAALVGALMPWLDVLGQALLPPLSPRDVLRSALATLARLGIDAGLHVACPGGLTPTILETLGGFAPVLTLSSAEAATMRRHGVDARSLDELLLVHADQLGHPGGDRPVGCDGSDEQASLLRALGFEPIDVGPDPLPDAFAFSPVARKAAEDRLAAAERGGARAILAPTPRALARFALITREGTWRSSRVLPLMPHQLAWWAEVGFAAALPTSPAIETRP